MASCKTLTTYPAQGLAGLGQQPLALLLQVAMCKDVCGCVGGSAFVRACVRAGGSSEF
jgi:hypothetical protein